MMAGFEAEPGDERLSTALPSDSLDGARGTAGGESLRAVWDRHRTLSTARWLLT